MIEKVVVTMNYIKAFIQSESSGGIMLLLAAILGVITANSPLAEQYFSLTAHGGEGFQHAEDNECQ